MDRGLTHPLVGPERLAKFAIVYLRQSTVAQVRYNTGSTAAQLDQRRLALDFGWPENLVKVIDDDLGRSGTGTLHRPGWQEMIRLIVGGHVSAVFVLLVSRLARELLGFEELRVVCKSYGAIMVIDGRPADPANPDDTVMLQLQAVLAQHENSSRARLLARIRREKAARGEVVSRLPAGWTENLAGELDYDPTVENVIRDVLASFRVHRTTLATVRDLHARGVQLPYRSGSRIRWTRAHARGVRQILMNPAYAGSYVYGQSEGRPDLGFQKNGYPVRRLVPEERRIRVDNHHPAYLTRDEQEQFKKILASNRFEQRHRPRSGVALCQGLLRCGRCGVSLSVQYKRSATPRYDCQRNQTTFGERRCINFGGKFLDLALETIFLSVAEAPSVPALRAEIDALVQGENDRDQYVASEMKRLRYEEKLAYERYHECDARNQLIAPVLAKEWNDAIAARTSFENTAAAAPRGPTAPSDEEVHQLLSFASDVGRIWRHPSVTFPDKKQLLRCLIDHVVVDRADDVLKLVIHWRSGLEQPVDVLLNKAVHRLVVERHGEGLTVKEIQRWLKCGDPVTGQYWAFSKARIYAILRQSGLTPHRPSRKRR